jgi:hypothetical protein
MRRLDDSFITLGEDLEREAQRLRGVSQVMPDGPEREEILQMARAPPRRGESSNAGCHRLNFNQQNRSAVDRSNTSIVRSSPPSGIGSEPRTR